MGHSKQPYDALVDQLAKGLITRTQKKIKAAVKAIEHTTNIHEIIRKWDLTLSNKPLFSALDSIVCERATEY